MAAPIRFSKLKGAENVTKTRQRPLGLGIVSSIYKKTPRTLHINEHLANF
jgi:hypothetical protein